MSTCLSSSGMKNSNPWFAYSNSMRTLPGSLPFSVRFNLPILALFLPYSCPILASFRLFLQAPDSTPPKPVRFNEAQPFEIYHGGRCIRTLPASLPGTS